MLLGLYTVTSAGLYNTVLAGFGIRPAVSLGRARKYKAPGLPPLRMTTIR